MVLVVAREEPAAEDSHIPPTDTTPWRRLPPLRPGLSLSSMQLISSQTPGSFPGG